MNDGEFVSVLAMHFRDAHGNISVGYTEQWYDRNADAATLSAVYGCNRFLKEQSVASTFELVSPDGELLISATILGPRFWQRRCDYGNDS